MIRQFLKCEITCSITQRILLTSALNILLPVKQLTVGWLLERRGHLVADIALIADPVLRVECQQRAGFTQAVIIVTGSVDGIGNPGELTVNRARELDVHSGGLVLSGVEFRVRSP